MLKNPRHHAAAADGARLPTAIGAPEVVLMPGNRFLLLPINTVLSLFRRHGCRESTATKPYVIKKLRGPTRHAPSHSTLPTHTALTGAATGNAELRTLRRAPRRSRIRVVRRNSIQHRQYLKSRLSTVSEQEEFIINEPLLMRRDWTQAGRPLHDGQEKLQNFPVQDGTVRNVDHGDFRDGLREGAIKSNDCSTESSIKRVSKMAPNSLNEEESQEHRQEPQPKQQSCRSKTSTIASSGFRITNSCRSASPEVCQRHLERCVERPSKEFKVKSIVKEQVDQGVLRRNQALNGEVAGDFPEGHCTAAGVSNNKQNEKHIRRGFGSVEHSVAVAPSASLTSSGIPRGPFLDPSTHKSGRWVRDGEQLEQQNFPGTSRLDVLERMDHFVDLTCRLSQRHLTLLDHFAAENAIGGRATNQLQEDKMKINSRRTAGFTLPNVKVIEREAGLKAQIGCKISAHQHQQVIPSQNISETSPKLDIVSRSTVIEARLSQSISCTSERILQLESIKENLVVLQFSNVESTIHTPQLLPQSETRGSGASSLHGRGDEMSRRFQSTRPPAFATELKRTTLKEAVDHRITVNNIIADDLPIGKLEGQLPAQGKSLNSHLPVVLLRELPSRRIKRHVRGPWRSQLTTLQRSLP